MAEAKHEERLASLLRSPKRRKFVIHYVENGGNATRAAEAAGYATPNVEGARLLRDDSVVQAIEKHANVVANVQGENRDTILNRMIGRANIDAADIWLDNAETRAEFNAAGLKHPADLDVGLRRAIKSISFTAHGPKVEFYPADAADRDLANLLGLLKRDDERLGADDAAMLIAAAMERMDELDHASAASE